MTVDVRINGTSIKQLLTRAPRITDSQEAACRTLSLQLQHVNGLEAYLGQNVELWYGNQRWFVGPLLSRGVDSEGGLDYKVLDPLFYTKTNPDDYFFKNLTATQIFRKVAENIGVRIGKLENTAAVLPPLYYQGAEGDKVLVDVLARTAALKSTKWWYRYSPDVAAEGLTMFEQKVPATMWAFQRGVNLESASLSESVEELRNVVKLVNRETGKVVTKVNASFVMRFGKMTHFEEVDKDQAANMERTAATLLAEKGVIQTAMQMGGVNPGNMGQFFSGDVIYVEERYTNLLGAYYVTSVTQTFEDSGVVLLSFDLSKAPHIPAIEYDDATNNPNADKAKKSAKATAAETGVQQTYSTETTAVLEKYGLNGVESEAQAKATESRDEALEAYKKIMEESGE